MRILACNRILASGQKPEERTLLGVVMEVGLENGLYFDEDSINAMFNDPTASPLISSATQLM